MRHTSFMYTTTTTLDFGFQISQEDKDTVYTRIKEWWQIGQMQQGAAYDSSDAGNMLPLV